MIQNLNTDPNIVIIFSPRNLFFRIWHLEQHGVKLVFVIEGDAPELKLETMARRQQARYGHARRGGANGGTRMAGKGQRSRFKTWLKEVDTFETFLNPSMQVLINFFVFTFSLTFIPCNKFE